MPDYFNAQSNDGLVKGVITPTKTYMFGARVKNG